MKERRVARSELSEVFAPLFSCPSSNEALKVVLIERCANRPEPRWPTRASQSEDHKFPRISRSKGRCRYATHAGEVHPQSPLREPIPFLGPPHGLSR